MGTVQEPGPTGRRVGEAVKAARKARALTVRALAAQLTDLGRPILASGINKIEQGQRRVDSDELVALALALNVSPLVLLLPDDDSGQEVRYLTENTIATCADTWLWGSGSQALPAEPGELPTVERQDDYERLLPPRERYGRRHPGGRVAELLRHQVFNLVRRASFTVDGDDGQFGRVLESVRAGMDRLAVEVDRIEAEHAELMRFREERRRQRGAGDA